jgi:hypothetical protein
MATRLVVPDVVRQDSAGVVALPGLPEICRLKSLAIKSLKYLFDEKENMFCGSAVRTRRGVYRESPSRKLTTIVLLGLERLAGSEATETFDLAAIRRALFADTSWIRSAEDFGLFVWCTALCAPDQFAAALNDFDWDKVVHTFADGRQGHTLGLTRLLTAIAHSRQVGAEIRTDLTDLAVAIYHSLRENQGGNGLFGHVAARQGIGGLFSGRFGTFADQMFAIYALVMFARAFDIDEPLEPALNCANAVCALQGPLGQWWSLYDKSRGCVAKRYPLYAVHQHGIAPLALRALEATSGISFEQPMRKGLIPIVGNRGSAGLGNTENYEAWDRLELCNGMTAGWKATLEILHFSRNPRHERLRVRCEARPEHFGWLLYAFGDLVNAVGSIEPQPIAASDELN